MNIIKLNAIDSTNDFLKNLKRESVLPDYTVVTAAFQKKGKGQMGSSWESESGKNLTLSVLKKFIKLEIDNSFYINIAVSLAIYKVVLKFLPKNNLSIKWPNDILSGRNKLAGILIENTVQQNFINDSVIGLGLNINQREFSSKLNYVTSLCIEYGTELAIDTIMEEYLKQLALEFLRVENSDFDTLKNDYEALLYKKEIPTMFKDNKNRIFLGKIKGISTKGNLLVELENEEIKSYSLKEIAML